MAKIAKEIDKQYGSLPKFAEQVWSHLGGDVAHGAGEEALWNEINRVCIDLLGESDGNEAATLLRERGFFSIVFPDDVPSGALRRLRRLRERLRVGSPPAPFAGFAGSGNASG